MGPPAGPEQQEPACPSLGIREALGEPWQLPRGNGKGGAAGVPRFPVSSRRLFDWRKKSKWGYQRLSPSEVSGETLEVNNSAGN